MPEPPPTTSAAFPQNRCRLFFVSVLAALLAVSGCVADDEVDKATNQFVQAATTLTHDYQSLLTNANAVEANNYIVNQTFAAAPINDPGLRGSAVLSADEIKCRGDAIKALSDYTAALATLAAGKPEDQIQADAVTASTSVKSLTSGLTTLVVTPPKGAKAPDFGTPAAAAATAIGDVLKVIENHRSASEIRASIKENDAKIAPLYKALEDESTFYFERQRSQMHLVEITLLHTYNVAIAAKPVDQAQLLQLSDHLEQYEKDSAALETSDPTVSIKRFESAHAALVNLVTAAKPEEKKKFLAELIAQIKSFAAEVKTPSKSPSTATNPTS
jgi:hypothetical protein